MEPKKIAEQDDELLSAMLDGELDDTAADALTERLAHEPQLARRLQALRETDESMRLLYAKVDELPMPQDVLDALESADAAADKSANNVVPFPRRLMNSFANTPVAIAASVALAAGFFVDRLFDVVIPPSNGIAALQARTVPQDSNLYDLLENGASATEVELDDGSTARLLLTFADNKGDWCRQMSIVDASTSAQALACRRNGNWRNEVLVFGEPLQSEYQLASATSTAVIGSAVDSLIGDREPVDLSQEQELIEAHWQQ